MAPPPEQGPMPEGPHTFLFSDLEGSTRLLEGHGTEAVARALDRHHAIFEEVVGRHAGVIFETVGDAVYATFARPADAIAAALDAHRALAAEAWDAIGGRLAARIAIHTGSVERRGSRYFGPPLFRAARLQALGYGEQTLVSSASAALVGTDLPPGARLVDRGVHRLKDLAEPERVFELVHPDLRQAFPPLKSLDVRPNNLPVQLSSFVGRENELAAVSRLVAEHRVVTVLGPGGIGKTRLALQVAADAVDQHPGGVWFVDLTSLRDALAVPNAMATAIGLQEAADRPVLETLTGYLRTRKVLLVLDNLEQILPGAARLIAEVVGSGPDVHALATSRRPMRIRGEVEVLLQPMSAGDPHRTDAELPEAIALFLARAQDVRPDLAIDAETGPLIAAICNQLDGLPLAIELAAARLRLFSLQALHDRLTERLPVLIGGARDVPERQQTLRAAIGWSEELLSAAERALFHRLGVFVGGFTLDGARAVAGADLDLGEDVEMLIAALLEHSLLRTLGDGAEPRFGMLETIREYAANRLVQAGADEVVLERMGAFLVDLARAADDQLLRTGQALALANLDAELANLRAMLVRLQDAGDRQRLPELVAALGRYWSMRGLSREGREWVSAAIPCVAGQGSDLEGRLRAAEGTLVSEVSPSQAVEASRAAVAIFRATGNGVGLARALVSETNGLINLGRFEEGERQAIIARDTAREAGDLRSEAAAIGNLASIALRQGRPDDAEPGVREAVELFRRAGDLRAVVIGQGNLGEIAAMRGDFATAVEQHRLGVEEAVRFGDPGLEGWELANLAQALGNVGEWQEAAAHLAEALPKLAAAEEHRALLDGLNIAGSQLAAGGDLEGAVLAWSAATHLSAVHGITLDDTVRSEDAVDAVRQRLDSAAVAEAEEQATRMALPEAVDLACARLGRLRVQVTRTPSSGPALRRTK